MQGFNMGRYVPPELEGVASFNQASGKKPTSRNADGSQTVRFECPFAIWCTNCQPETIIAQGVRFNAHKKPAGKYFSSPIWSFRFKHTVCGGWIEVRTDPKNTEYVVTEGGRRRDYGEGKIEFEIEGVGSQAEALVGAEDALGRLEKKSGDKKAADAQQVRVEELRKRAERDWADPYEMNKKIRREFRIGRRMRDDSKKTGQALQEKFGLGFDLAPVDVKDAERAKLIDFATQNPADVSKRSLFKQKRETESSKSMLQASLQGNTRLKSDPFMSEAETTRTRAGRETTVKKETVSSTSTLVNYDSD